MKARFIPNVFLTLAHRPDECRAFFAYHDALMHETPLNKAEREMIWWQPAAPTIACTASSRAARSARVHQITHRRPGCDQSPQRRKSPKQRAMLDFALKVCLHSGNGWVDFAALPGTGYHDDIWDIGSITAFASA